MRVAWRKCNGRGGQAHGAFDYSNRSCIEPTGLRLVVLGCQPCDAILPQVSWTREFMSSQTDQYTTASVARERKPSPALKHLGNWRGTK